MKSLHPIAISPSGQRRSTRAKNKHHTTLNYIKRFINQHLHRCRGEAALMFKAVAVVRLTFQRCNRSDSQTPLRRTLWRSWGTGITRTTMKFNHDHGKEKRSICSTQQQKTTPQWKDHAHVSALIMVGHIRKTPPRHRSRCKRVGRTPPTEATRPAAL